MSLPNVTQTVTDGALGILPIDSTRRQAKIGVCSAGVPNQVYEFAGDTNAMTKSLGRGPVVEAAAQIHGPVIVVPATPDVVSVLADPKDLGAGGMDGTGNAGAGTVTAAKALDKTIYVQITTGGALGTAKFKVSIGGGAWGPIITTGSSPSPWLYRVPGASLVVLSFAPGTYVADGYATLGSYSIALDGTITENGTSPSSALAGTTFEALDTYDMVVTISQGGALGAGTFEYSMDGGDTFSGQILIPGSGVYVIPNSGLKITFSSSTFVAGDSYVLHVDGPAYTVGSMQSAMDALTADARTWFMLHIVGTPTTTTNAATLAAAVDAKMVTAAGLFRYAAALTECPNNGDLTASVGGQDDDLTEDDDDEAIAAFAAQAYSRTGVANGDCELVSVLTGRVDRRNSAWAISARLSNIAPSEDPGFVGRGPLTGVRSLHRDENATPGLNDARFMTLRTHTGMQGFFVTEGKMMTVDGSDFSQITNRRVMDVALSTSRQGLLPFLSGSVRVDKKTGFIDERDALKIEAKLGSALRTALVAPGDASDASVSLNRSTNILASSAETVTTRVLPLAYLKHISNDIGFVNPASG